MKQSFRTKKCPKVYNGETFGILEFLKIVFYNFDLQALNIVFQDVFECLGNLIKRAKNNFCQSKNVTVFKEDPAVKKKNVSVFSPKLFCQNLRPPTPGCWGNLIKSKSLAHLKLNTRGSFIIQKNQTVFRDRMYLFYFFIL